MRRPLPPSDAARPWIADVRRALVALYDTRSRRLDTELDYDSGTLAWFYQHSARYRRDALASYFAAKVRPGQLALFA